MNLSDAMRKKTFIFSAIILFLLPLIVHAQSLHTTGKLKIAASQFPVSSHIDSNAHWIMQHMREASTAGADIIHFPECALSGYAGVDFKSMENLDWQTLRRATQKIIDLADTLNLYVLLGSTHRLSEGNKPHNSIYVIDTSGNVMDRYDKRFCTGGDLDYYSPGDHFVTFQLNGVNCGLLICYDVRFPELYREYVKLDVDIIFQSFYNARQKPGGIHPKIMPVTAQGHAGVNYFFISLTNSSAAHSWPCHFITPDGLISGKLTPNQPGVLYSEVDITKKYYDASKKHRMNAINGKLYSGELVEDERSQNRTGF